MAKRSPQTFQKRQREQQKQLKRQEKMDRRLDRSEAKRLRRDGETNPSETNPDGEQAASGPTLGELEERS